MRTPRQFDAEVQDSHVLALTRVALDHLVVGLEARKGHLGDGVDLVEGLVSGDDRSVGGQREMDTGEAKGEKQDCQLDGRE
jgi:hypothetical protein